MSRNSSEGRGPLQACISELLQAFSCNIRAKVKLCVLCGEMLLRTVGWALPTLLDLLCGFNRFAELNTDLVLFLKRQGTVHPASVNGCIVRSSPDIYR
mgnify:CR=1 FL=1